jgi:hypothetical protein
MKPAAQHIACSSNGSVMARIRRARCKPHLSNLAVIALLTCIVPSTGCMQPRHSRFQVPVACLHFTAESFTGPCKERNDGKIICDKVVVTARCIQVGKSH